MHPSFPATRKTIFSLHNIGIDPYFLTKIVIKKKGFSNAETLRIIFGLDLVSVLPK
jgi:hypothetical protein